MITLGMHTCRMSGGKAFVLENAPFFAENVFPENKKDKYDKQQFLGSGYYFWDDNKEMADIWGMMHCGGRYFIVACEINISETKCFDLVGSRKCQKALESLLEKLLLKGRDKSHWTVSRCIDHLKNLAEHDPEIFPFENIRAVDYQPPDRYKQKEMDFVSTETHYTILNPKIAICVLDKETLPLRTLRIIE